MKAKKTRIGLTPIERKHKDVSIAYAKKLKNRIKNRNAKRARRVNR